MEDVRGGFKNAFTARFPKGAAPDTPVVILLGWAGATDKQLVKYAELLDRRGLPSVRSVQPLWRILELENPKREWAEALLRYLEELGLDAALPNGSGRGIVWWSFSNGGAYVLDMVRRLAEESGSRHAWAARDTLGWIMDSCPGFAGPNALKRVLETVMPSWIGRQYAMARSRLRTAISSRDLSHIFWENMRVGGWGKPECYIYSKGDDICQWEKISELVEDKRRRGVDITERLFEDSPHVLHFRSHPEEYASIVNGFLDRVTGAGLRARL